MSPTRQLGMNVFDAALDRLTPLYEEGHRLVVSFSGGKDSTVVLNMCLLAAQMTGRLPVEVVMRDDEIMFPGTFEYAERVWNRPDVELHWLVQRQPVVNLFNREMPYFWAFDPLLDPEEWVRQPPPFAEFRPDFNIDSMTTPLHFPPPPGKNLYAVVGLRVEESLGRRMGLHSSGGHTTRPNRFDVRNHRPIYDWSDGDVWLAIDKFGWDKADAYDVLYRMGLPRKLLRLAPPTMNPSGVPALQLAAKAWPQWFERVARRLPGIRSAALFGKKAILPDRHHSESWEQCFQRLCIDEAPQWIAERATRLREQFLSNHRHHAARVPFPDVTRCPACGKGLGSWKLLTEAIYNGDPFSTRCDSLPYVEPEYFRPGAGTWAKGAKVGF